jgi:GT2 family glycosyltransferase
VFEHTPLVACVVLNWNGWQDTIDCLAALKASAYTNLRIVVVDNGSSNDSVARIRAAHPDVTLLESNLNLGFAGGNNIGIRHALGNGAEYVWLLNNDTKPAPSALSALVSKALTDKRIGAVGSICYYANAPSRVQAWGGSRVNLWIGYSRLAVQPCPEESLDSLNGASILVSRNAFESAGLLDAGFFLYWEDTEFSIRLRKHKWKLGVAPGSHVLHKVNASTGGNKIALDRFFTASGLRILRLHAPVPPLSLLLFAAMRLIKRLGQLEFARCRSVWAGIGDYRRMLPLSPKIR